MKHDIYTFRGRRNNCAWVYGALIRKDSCPYIARFDEHMGAVFFTVEEESIGQCTGLPDKNGKIAFAGDILEIKLTSGQVYRTVLVWDKNRAAFYEVSGWDTKFRFPIDKRIVGRKTIVGNIFDNKELLKGE